MVTNYGFVVDRNACIGCHACNTACKIGKQQNALASMSCRGVRLDGLGRLAGGQGAMPLVNPYGKGKELRPLLLTGEGATTLPRVAMGSRETSDLIMLGNGAFTPLLGFMGRADWKGVCDALETAEGIFWPIPITLSVGKVRAKSLRVGLRPPATERSSPSAGPESVPPPQRPSSCRPGSRKPGRWRAG